MTLPIQQMGPAALFQRFHLSMRASINFQFITSVKLGVRNSFFGCFYILVFFYVFYANCDETLPRSLLLIDWQSNYFSNSL